MKTILEHIVNNWQLDATQEDVDKYFYTYEEVDSIIDGKNCYVIGRKGAGKTAISQHILRQRSYNIFAESLSFKHFPFNELYAHEDRSYRKPNQYITFWKYIIYLYTCKMMAENQAIDQNFREAIKNIIPNNSPNLLSREIRKWTGVEFGAQLAEHIGKLHIKLDAAYTQNRTTWVERTNILEDLITTYCDQCNYYIVFDELDEDYVDSTSKDNEQYIDLLKGLFKAVQSTKAIFRSSNLNIKPVIFLRDDIYGQIKDSDKNKWSDFKLELSWTPEKIKALLAYRISKEHGQTNMSFENAWNSIFQKNLRIYYGDNKRKQKPVFDFILINTHLRPRDFISYIKCCCEIALQRDKSFIGWSEVKAADRKFSNYLKNELEDEITPLIPPLDHIWRILSEMRKPIFSEADFEKAYLTYQRYHHVSIEISLSTILETLFEFSILGNQHKTQHNSFFFKYQHTNMTYNPGEHLVVHRGLLKALQIL